MLIGRPRSSATPRVGIRIFCKCPTGTFTGSEHRLLAFLRSKRQPCHGSCAQLVSLTTRGWLVSHLCYHWGVHRRMLSSCVVHLVSKDCMSSPTSLGMEHTGSRVWESAVSVREALLCPVPVGRPASPFWSTHLPHFSGL